MNQRGLTIVTLSLLFGFIGWILHALFESFFLPDKTFLQLFITQVSMNDYIVRLLVSSCFFIGGIFLFQNMFHHRHSEEELKKETISLHLANSVLEEKIKKQTEEIEAVLKQKNDLIVGLSHDLNTPLTPLMGFLPMIIREEKDPKLKELLELSLRNVHYIRDIVSRTIDLALLDSSVVTFSMEKTNLLTEVGTVLDNRFFLLNTKQIYVNNKIDEHVFVNADKIKLREVINNLLLNSIKYSSNEGTIIIDAAEENGQILFSITDDGIGLSNEQLHHIFDELYKADVARQDHKSTGLGLSICKRIVERHGGKIWAESSGIGKGTTVFFTIPALIET